jgi:protein-tyrosine phosphatase
MDLRTKYALLKLFTLFGISKHNRSEHVKQAQKRQRDIRMPGLLEPTDALTEPIKIPGIDYIEINLNGKGFERSLLWQLSLWSFL